MSDYYETIVDRDVSLQHASEEAASVLKWLVAQKIVSGKPNDDCVPSDEAPGYRAGSQAEIATNGESCDSNRKLKGWVGMSILIERRFFEGDLAGFDVICPSCYVKSSSKKEWRVAAENWQKRKPPYDVTCKKCGHTKTITEWICDRPWVFGNLAFRFWNWPPLSATLLSRLSQRLGHRLILTQTKF